MTEDWDDPAIPREAESREDDARSREMREYVPPALLPEPHPQHGWQFRWIRTTMVGGADNTNVSRKLREGWQPVKAEEVPELKIDSDFDSRFAAEGNVVVGGLMLCKIPEERAKARNAYFARKAGDQMAAVDNDLMKEADPRMPLHQPERSSRVTFGSGGN